MEKIKSKIEKLLRLSLSDSPHEATNAAQRAIELMEKYNISREDIDKHPIIFKEIEINYARVPGWVRTLYRNIASINGCYMVWKDGIKGEISKSFVRKAKIILIGMKSDIENIDYYVNILIKRIKEKAKEFKKTCNFTDRQMMKSYRMGLVEGCYKLLLKASQTFNENIKNNALVMVDERCARAEKFYKQNHVVRTVATDFVKCICYLRGIEDGSSFSVNRPINEQDTNPLALELKTSENERIKRG